MSHILLFILIYPMISVSHIQFHIPIPMRFTSTTRNLFSFLCILHLSIFDFYVLSMYSFTNFALFKRFNIMNINLNFNAREQPDTAFTTYRGSRSPKFLVIPFEFILNVFIVLGIFFKYELSSILVRVSEVHRPFWQFLVRLCGIVGGIFATSG